MTRARFDDAVADRAFVFDAAPREIVVARSPRDVLDVLHRVEAGVAAGAWAYGFVGYEAGVAFEPAMAVHPDRPGTPMAWFALGGPPRVDRAIRPSEGPAPYWVGPWRPDTTAAQHAAGVRHVQARIAAGDVYQANLTARFHARVLGDLLACYADLVAAQRGADHAFVDLGRHVVLSASPELFFEWTAGGLRCAPMKGTARRGATPDDDARRRADLLGSPKEIAENVMIVDLLRNDLGRLAEPGSVAVTSLLAAEPYGSVWQLVSTVRAVPRPATTLTDVFAALFPCGSVTGAPKIAATRVIAELERAPRGVYCGAIGWVAPPGSEVRARFNVAIRTLVVDRRDGTAGYGSGGGITTGSRAHAEWEETLTKTAVLDALASGPVSLIETLGHDGAHLVNLDRHLARIAGSAATFGFPFDEQAVRAALARTVFAGPTRVSLTLAPDGDLSIRVAALERSPQPVRLAVDELPVDSTSLWLRHKTTRREVYEAARLRHAGADDVLLRNERGEITESTIATVAVRLDGAWYTPPVDSGCLPGVGRALALEQGRLTERVLTLEDVHRAEALALVSSLRGWRPAVLAVPGSSACLDG